MRYTCDVLVLGGGPAGMAAAVSAASRGVRVLLVEKEAFIGGRWAEYACKAGQECSSCNICLGFELLEELESESRVQVLTGSYAGEALGTAGDFKIRLIRTSPSIDPRLCTFCGRCIDACPEKAISMLPRRTRQGLIIRRHRCRAYNGGCRACAEVCPQGAVKVGADEVGTVKAKAIVVATGASSPEPDLLPEYGWGRYPEVLTTLELERFLAAEDWQALTGRRWAFVQCAGSRSRRLGRDYCSRFCCGVSLRLLLRLYTLGLVDEAAIFYMDLQFNSQRDEEVFEELRTYGLRFVRGLPAEVRKGEAGLLLRFEDLEVGRIEAAEFDHIVLSVGLAPSLDNPLPGMLGEHYISGFWQQEREGVFLAGSCRGPMDIKTAVLDGRAAGEQAAESVLRSGASGGIAQSREHAADVLVWGSGSSGLLVAREVLAAGCSVLMLADSGNWDPADPTGLMAKELWREAGGREGFLLLWEGAELIKLNGEPENFEAWVKVPGQGVRVVRIKAVILASRFVSRAPVPATTQAELAKDLVTGSFSVPETGGPVVFWLDVNSGSPPAVHALALENARAVRENLGSKVKIYYIARQVKVGAAPHLEALYGRLREAGVVFVKPAGRPAWDGKNLLFADPTTSVEGRPEEVKLFPSALIVGEELSLPPEAQQIWRAVFSRVSADVDEAVSGGGVVTSRRGVFLAGAGLAPENPEVAREQALLAARAALAVASGTAYGAQSDLKCAASRREAGYCAACLTCARTCPHGAVTVEGKALVYQKSCWGCGLCAAECPARGLEASGHMTPAGLMEAIGSNGKGAIAFLCQHSAWRSLKEAEERALALPQNIAWVPVPCAGSVDMETVLAMLERGASGVMVLGCRRRACQHVYGTVRAAKRVEGLRQRLAEAGLDSRKIKFAAVGPCNPGELIREVQGFLAQLETADKAGW